MAAMEGTVLECGSAPHPAIFPLDTPILIGSFGVPFLLHLIGRCRSRFFCSN